MTLNSTSCFYLHRFVDSIITQIVCPDWHSLEVLPDFLIVYYHRMQLMQAPNLLVKPLALAP
jgi:hypothetical protein